MGYFHGDRPHPPVPRDPSLEWPTDGTPCIQHHYYIAQDLARSPSVAVNDVLQLAGSVASLILTLGLCLLWVGHLDVILGRPTSERPIAPSCNGGSHSIPEPVPAFDQISGHAWPAPDSSYKLCLTSVGHLQAMPQASAPHTISWRCLLPLPFPSAEALA